jgi:hypothetical protein
MNDYQWLYNHGVNHGLIMVNDGENLLVMIDNGKIMVYNWWFMGWWYGT